MTTCVFDVFVVQEDTPEWRSSYTSSTLVIMRFQSDFQGNYTCVASNAFRMKKQTFYLSGRHSPTFTLIVPLRNILYFLVGGK